MNQKLEKFIERLPDELSVLKLHTGTSQKNHLQAVYVINGTSPRIQSQILPQLIDRSEAPEEILTEAENLGWGTDFTHIRVMGYTEEMEYLKSIQLSQPIQWVDDTPNTNGDYPQAITQLTQGMLAMSAEIRRTLHVVTEQLAHRETVQAEMIETLMDSRRMQAEAEANHMRLENYLEAEGLAGNDTFKAAAMEQLGSIFQTVIAAKNAAPSIDTIKAWANSNPEFVDTLIEDEELVSKVVNAYMTKQATTDPE